MTKKATKPKTVSMSSPGISQECASINPNCLLCIEDTCIRCKNGYSFNEEGKCVQCNMCPAPEVRETGCNLATHWITYTGECREKSPFCLEYDDHGCVQINWNYVRP